MYIRLVKLWEETRSSYWFVPGLMVSGAILLSLVTVSLEGYFQDRVLRSLGFIWSGAQKARAGDSHSSDESQSGVSWCGRWG